jgi:hypothetical protein
MTIKLTGVTRNAGEVTLAFQYTDGAATKTKTFSASEIVLLLRDFKCLVGRNPAQAELKDIIATLFNGVRRGADVVESIPWESWININLEA